MRLSQLNFSGLFLGVGVLWCLVVVNGRSKSVVLLAAKPPNISLPNSATPFVTLYGDDFFRGDYYHHYLRGECTNLPSTYDNWASSIDAYDKCIILFDQKNCGGSFSRVHATNVDRLSPLKLNDKVSSIKYCYTFAERGK